MLKVKLSILGAIHKLHTHLGGWGSNFVFYRKTRTERRKGVKKSTVHAFVLNGRPFTQSTDAIAFDFQ